MGILCSYNTNNNLFTQKALKAVIKVKKKKERIEKKKFIIIIK